MVPLAQEANALPSSEHVKPTALWVSVKVKTAEVEVVGFGGDEVIVGVGGTMAQTAVVAELVEVPDTASTWKLWLPWARPV